MADSDAVEITKRGSEWEVVQLTASTYAASSRAKLTEHHEEDKVVLSEPDPEMSRPLFMSGHFVFPPSQHENLPLESDVSVSSNKTTMMDDSGEVSGETGNECDQTDGDNWMLKELSDDGEFPIPVSEFREDSISAFLNYDEKNSLGGNTINSAGDVNEVTNRDFSSAMDIRCLPRFVKDAEHGKSTLPCNVWWKRTAVALYSQVKQTNTLWSVLIAAAVMGLVVLGQRWQQEMERVLQLKCERSGKLLGSIYRLKEVIVGGYRQGSLVVGATPDEM